MQRYSVKERGTRFVMGLLLVTLSFAVGASGVPVTLKSGEFAPAWELKDSDGEVLQFPDDLEGPTLVFFWATWCPYCKALMPHLQSILDEQPELELTVYALSINEDDDADPTKVLAQNGFQFRSFPNADDVARGYGVKATPGLFLVNEKGEILFDLADHRRPPVERLGDIKDASHRTKAARIIPWAAAQLRKALDQLPASR